MVRVDVCPWVGSSLLYTVLKSLIDHNTVYLVSADIFWDFPCVQSVWWLMEPCIHNYHVCFHYRIL